jgi:hypothetical protein
MTDRGLGDNGGPPLEEPAKFSKRKWALKLFQHPEKPVGAIAMAFKLYIEMDAAGRGAAVSDVEFALCCGVSLRSSWTFKKWLLENGFVEIKVRGARGRQTEFVARIPGDEIQAMVAGIMDQLPAQNARNNDEDCEQSEDGIQATPAGISGLLAMAAGNPEEPSRTRVEYNNLNNITTYPTNSEFGDRGLGGKPLLPEPLETVIQKLTEIEAKIDQPRKRAKKEIDPNEPTPAEALEAFHLYNDMALRCGLPQAAKCTPKRGKDIAARMKEHGGLDAWKQALTNIERSAYLRGQNKDGWRADLDFLVRPARFTKVWEGGWGNGADHSENFGETEDERWARIVAETDEKEARQ